ncbi:unnamed protein product, partial [Nezara viridula]
VRLFKTIVLENITDCLHLQLYRDSKDRYKQGQTKASLSLQHFLGVETGFTLDKESNTIAILCQDVTVVLAFDTRERLIQWQVKIASNLGEDQQFLVQICSAPHKSKLAPGPARLHVQEYRFCISLGVPPRLVGVWEISQLRRYGVVEGRFCFEGGSRCGKGEGLYVLITDQAEEITRTLQAASEGRLLSTRRRSSSRNMSVMDSPRKCLTRLSSAGCDSASLCQRIDMGEHSCSHDWPSTETRTTDSVDFGDTVSVSDYPDQSQDVSRWSMEPGMGRCASCISKLGAMSRSSTAANTPAAAFSPAWVMDMGRSIGSGSHNSNCSTMSVSSHESGSEYSIPRLPSNDRSEKVGQCDCEGPGRPPKPGDVAKTKKPPMPSPALQNQNFANYDVPKTIYPQIPEEKGTVRNQPRPPEEYYDTPRSVKTELAEYDRPLCACQTKVVLDEPWQQQQCPCRILCWPSAWISLPYCRRGNGIENTSVHLHKVKLSGEGKMPVMNKSGELAIYATVDKSKKVKYRNLETKDNKIETVDETDNDTTNSENNSNYVNIDPTEKDCKGEQNVNYENLDFAHSLEYYENARDVLQKAGLNKEIPCFDTDKNGVKFCSKCGHACEENSDYLMMEPSAKPGVKFPGYLPMHPSSKSDIIKSRLSRGLSDRASSIPSLSDRCNRRSDSDMRVPGSAMLGLNHPQSANSSPYLTRRAPLMQRKRSSSADSSRGEDDDVTLCSKEPPPPPTQPSRTEEPPAPVLQETVVQVRRSCSVPCKPGNRDSSSSADSGVSTGSLKQREDFGEFELPLTTALSCRRLRLAQETPCLHSSLPRRSKSSDPLSQLSFQFHKIKVPAKSSSAEAEIPICHGKREPKEYCSPGGDGAIVVPYTDSRSTSSGTSDMSDYIETLSLSSHSSSDTPDSLRLGRIAATTLRPRSGKEYHKIDRYILESDIKLKSITTVPEKCESPSPGYMSSSPGN